MMKLNVRRNLSLNKVPEKSWPALSSREHSLEDAKRKQLPTSKRLKGSTKSLTRVPAPFSRKTTVAVLDALLSDEPSKVSTSVANTKLSQLHETKGFGWKTERVAKDYSIKKNSSEWVHLKERLQTQKVIPGREEIPFKPSASIEHKQGIADFLASVAKIGNDANHWLGEESRSG
jgi:hypothetical protein